MPQSGRKNKQNETGYKSPWFAFAPDQFKQQRVSL